MDIASVRSRLTAAFVALAVAAVAVSIFTTVQARAADDTPTRNEHFTADTNLLRPSGYTADELNRFVASHGHPDSPLAHNGDAFVQAERETGVNAQYMLAHAILESTWGTSSISRDKHNFFGNGARDECPSTCAKSYPSDRDDILEQAHYVKDNYLSPGGSGFHPQVGPTLRGMSTKPMAYASDPTWAPKIANIADEMYSPMAAPPG